MAGAGATILCGALVAAAWGPRLCCGVEVLTGLKGHSFSFPAPHSDSGDIARVTWRSRGTHMAEAKPRERLFAVDYLPGLRGRLLLHPTNLSLEISPLKLEDGGRYEVVVDTFSDPAKPKTFSYLLLVRGGSAGSGGGGGDSGSTAGPWGETEPGAGHATPQGDGGGHPPGGGGGPGTCGVRDRYCVVKGYLVAAVLGPLLVLVAVVHIVTRGKATEPGGCLG